jgi:hypothetical protein
MKKLLLLASVVCLIAVAGHANGQAPRMLTQGWSDMDRLDFYTRSQGSQLILLSWFKALEQADSQQLFTAGMTRYGYLPNSASPDGLPVGFTTDRDKARTLWVGMTCAACHTSNIEYGGKVLRIEGGSTDADLFSFLADLNFALQATVTDASKFDRFAASVLTNGDTPEHRRQLQNELIRFAAQFQTFVNASSPNSPWGPARADAFGMIFNRVSAIDLTDGSGNPIERNNRPPNAPVSYPSLWGTSRFDKVQWNGIAPNKASVERLSRNVVEAMGVFSRVDLQQHHIRGYESSVRLRNLLHLEEKLIKKLQAPEWPADLFGAIDQNKVQQGRVLYDQYCKGCHQIVPRNSAASVNTVVCRLDAVAGDAQRACPGGTIRTDRTMADNAACRNADTGILAGSARSGHRLANPDFVAKLVTSVGIGVIEFGILSPLSSPLNMAVTETTAVPPVDAASIAPLAGPTPAQVPCVTSLQAYLARPLSGIWATAPYLHNGSVPNLYELLLPEGRRSPKFYVGDRSFDPRNVGFVATSGLFLLDTTLPGNSNRGHEYGLEMTDEQRWLLVEFLKTL